MWRNAYLALGPLRGAWCIDPNGWPWTIVLAWVPRSRPLVMLIDWERKGVQPDGD